MTLEKVKEHFKNALYVKDHTGDQSKIKDLECIYSRFGNNFFYDGVQLWEKTKGFAKIIEHKDNNIMTLEKVKEHFKNALYVKDYADDKSKIKNLEKNTYKINSCFFCEGIQLWGKVKGFAEIIEYKNKPLSISENVLKKIYNANKNEKKKLLEKEFPEIFDKFQIGKWYRIEDEPKTLLCYTGSEENTFYGFGYSGKWTYRIFVSKDKRCLPVKDVDVYPILLDELHGRGFPNHQVYKLKNGKMYDSKGETVMENGFWSVPTIVRNGQTFKLVKK